MLAFLAPAGGDGSTDSGMQVAADTPAPGDEVPPDSSVAVGDGTLIPFGDASALAVSPF